MKDLRITLMDFNLVLATVADRLCERQTATTSKIVRELKTLLHVQLVAVMECSTLLIRVIESAEEGDCEGGGK